MLPMKRIALILTAVALGAAATAAAATPAVTITIRHQTRQCHTWSVDGNAWKATQSVSVAHGASLFFRNNDVMPHRLVEVSGPALRLSRAANMRVMGATFRLSLPTAGTYRFTTKPGEDYMTGVKTTGEDNTLILTVKVT
jgi:plastocyanin